MIKFGTDGWRGKIADDFTFENASIVAQGIANYIIKEKLKEKGIVIGYDNRFLSKEYAYLVSRILTLNGIPNKVSKEPIPTPVLSFAVKENKSAGGIMITASHNPPEWNGIKFKASYAGSANKETTDKIEEEIKYIKNTPRVDNAKKVAIENFKKPYINNLKKFINFGAIKKSKQKIVVDYMHGSALGYFGEVLKKHKVEVIEINCTPDPLFGGISPEPIPKNLDELISQTKDVALKYPEYIVTGIALDGDGDRICAVDQNGNFISPHNIFSILLKHFVESKNLTGEVVKTFNITKLIDKLCKKYNLKLHEVPIGFKHICELMLDKDILIGGEESGGIGIKNYIPERDGILCGLLLLEAISYQGKHLGLILKDLFDEFGTHFYDRSDIPIGMKESKEIAKKIKDLNLESFAGEKIKEIQRLDGTKFIFDDESWILFRPSGTEPLIRIYCEAKSLSDLEKLIAEGEKFISNL